VDTHVLQREYFSEGTAGFAVIRRFYSRYSDLLTRAHLVDIDDVVHEVFLSLSRTDFTEVRDVEHYVMRAIKLRCWSLLDKALREKALTADRHGTLNEEENEERRTHDLPAPNDSHPLTDLEGIELLTNLNSFKSHISPREARLLNLLIDETERLDIAKVLGLNINTLDTTIRRLRIRLADYLKNLGYTYKAFERFE
jgi:RNA polymerase sigma factor (sigma-70 family)